MTKRKRRYESDDDERIHSPTEETDIFGRTLPQSKRRKIAPSESLERIRSKLQANGINSKSNKPSWHQQLHKLRNKQLEKESKRDGLDKQITINWERPGVKQMDYKLDEKQFEQHPMSHVIEQQQNVNHRQTIIECINDKYNEELLVDAINTRKIRATNEKDQTHFDAIFSKPKHSDIDALSRSNPNLNDMNHLKKVNEMTECKEQNPKPKANSIKKTKKKKSWRERVKKYQ
eukprot:130634_1